MSAAVVAPASAAGRCLEQRREALNDLLRAGVTHGADPSAVLAAVADLAPILDTCASVLDDAQLGDLAEALVETAAGLCARGRWQVGTPERRTVCELVPTLAPWLRADVRVIVAGVVPAAVAVARGGDLAGWFARLTAAAQVPGPDSVNSDTAASLLLVAAWRSGLARYRTAALARAAALPPALAGAVLDLPPDLVPDVLAATTADPMEWPGAAEAGVVARYGGFRGFGGSWLTRPTVIGRSPAGWTLEADGELWTLVCDAHGGVVVRGGPPPHEVARGGALPPVPWDDDVTGLARSRGRFGETVLVSRAHSYYVDLLRVRP